MSADRSDAENAGGGWIRADGARIDAALLGSEGATLARLARAGVAVAETWAAPLTWVAPAPEAAARDLLRRSPIPRWTAWLGVAAGPTDLTEPIVGDGVDALAVAAAALDAAWSTGRVQRRLRAAGAPSASGVLIVQATPSSPRRIERWDPASGSPTPDLAVADATVAAAAERALAETLGAPLILSAGETASGQRVVSSARRASVGVAAEVAIAVARAADPADEAAALLALKPERLEELIHKSIAPDAPRDVLSVGLPAAPGAAVGRLCLSADKAAEIARGGAPVVLARPETDPEDVHGVAAAAGLLTLRGGLSSHAAVVARGLGVPCVVGAGAGGLEIDGDALVAQDGRRLSEGAWITIDGSRGEALFGETALRQPEPTGDLAALMAIADRRRRLAVRANADTVQDAETAVRLGCDGVGLCRTEHMFFDAKRITAIRRMIMADGETERRAAVDVLLPMQRADFEALFETLVRGVGDGAPLTVRLLDPPLHEFLPQSRRGLERLARALDEPFEKVEKRARDLSEINPMLGKRGCRMGVAYPEIYEMQARAAIEAVLAVRGRIGAAPKLELMIPLVSAVRELDLLRNKIADVAREVAAELSADIDVRIGIMIETPRAAIRADALAPLCGFFSFGTNDLTQMTYGLSRDDAGRLMRDYVARGVFEADPFATLDEDGVGELIRLGVARGRGANPSIEIGMCGEHGGAPNAIEFCESLGFDYVSCSPFRAPIARLAAAQATIRRDLRRQAKADRP